MVQSEVITAVVVEGGLHLPHGMRGTHLLDAGPGEPVLVGEHHDGEGGLVQLAEPGRSEVIRAVVSEGSQ